MEIGGRPSEPVLNFARRSVAVAHRLLLLAEVLELDHHRDNLRSFRVADLPDLSGRLLKYVDEPGHAASWRVDDGWSSRSSTR